MILVDTSILVAWLDKSHPEHKTCTEALMEAAARDELAVSAVSLAELAAGGRTREAVEADLSGFRRLDLDFESAWCVGTAFRTYRPARARPNPCYQTF